jgi:hypothetical protein
LDKKMKGKKVFTFRSGVERLPLRYAPGLYGHAYTIDADVEIPTDGAEGVIVADGGILGGFSLFLKDSHLYYEVNVANDHSEQIVSKTPIHAGVAHIQLNVTPTPENARNTPGVPGFSPRRPVPGDVKLSVNGVCGRGSVLQHLRQRRDVGRGQRPWLSGQSGVQVALPLHWQDRHRCIPVELIRLS